MEPILSVRNLTVDLAVRRELRRILYDVSLDVYPGEIVGLVGESGSGKSVTAAAIMQLLPGGAKAITGGSVTFQGQDLTRVTPKTMREIRGRDISMIFQEPMTSLNPVFTVESQFVDVARTHQKLSSAAARQRALELLQAVRISDPARVLNCYPHELSGGMRQRVMIAMAQSCSPALLIADEPTTALDVTIQAQILRLLQAAAREKQTAVLLISHDLGVVSQLCRRVAVMYAGEIVECGLTDDILQAPRHPYTRALLKSVPDFGTPAGQLTSIDGTVPDAGAVMPGCRFQPRCPEAYAHCLLKAPEPVWLAGNHNVRCCRLAGEEVLHDGCAAVGGCS
ncbi:MAG TPA: ABC transporter ATP-binding protein [Patescibacteria group bacterium]|nr:ABC transporter ATP-binding protein [Patescibacteria group bacterium]